MIHCIRTQCSILFGNKMFVTSSSIQSKQQKGHKRREKGSERVQTQTPVSFLILPHRLISQPNFPLLKSPMVVSLFNMKTYLPKQSRRSLRLRWNRTATSSRQTTTMTSPTQHHVTSPRMNCSCVNQFVAIQASRSAP